MADSQSGAHTLVGAVSFGYGCARVHRSFILDILMCKGNFNLVQHFLGYGCARVLVPVQLLLYIYDEAV